MDDEPRPSQSTQLSLPPPRSECLAVDELVAMADGVLPPERSDFVLAHVDGCESCADLVGSLGIFDGEGGKQPKKLGRYQLERLLGVGGMGMVYVAWDPELQRQVAMKLVRPEHASGKMRERMLGEARALARVSHPHVMSVHDVGEHDGEIFLATELVDGETLGAWQLGRGTAEVVAAWVQVARGLAAAHAEAVVHRDVKPSNALVGRDGRVRIGDFGIAYQLGKEDDATAGEIVGTPAYMAPEQRDGVVDARADQFSVCVCLVEALARKRPVADARIELAPAQLLAPLAAALTRGLRRDPAERFGSMSELADALEAAMAAAAAAQAPPASQQQLLALPRRSWRWLWVVAALAFSFGLVRGLFSSTQDSCLPPELPAALATPEARAHLRDKLPADPELVLGRWLAQWQAAAAEVCAAPSPPELRARRVACLDEQRAHLERLLVRLQAKPPANPLLLFIAFEELPRPSRCSPKALLTLLPADGQLLTLPADPDEASRRAERVREQLAAAGGDPYLEGKLEFALGKTLLAARRDNEALAAFERARRSFRIAEGAEGLHEATTLVSIAGVYYKRADRKAADEAMTTAGAIFRRFGIDEPIGPPRQDPEELIEQLLKIYKLAITSGDRTETTFDTGVALAAAYILAGKDDEALALYRAAASLGEALHLENEKLAFAYNQITALLLDVVERGGPEAPGVLEGVADPARRAVALAERLQLPVELATALNQLGRYSLARGEDKVARAALTRALELRMRNNEPARFRGSTRFLLARATWSSEPARALELAHAARLDLEGALATLPDNERDSTFVRTSVQTQLAAIDRWLAAHKQ